MTPSDFTPVLTEKDISRFWSHVKKSTTADCWEWQAFKLPGGYGKFQHSGRSLLAHRVALQIRIGPIPKGMLACHSCDNRSCCNPEHLFIGSYSDNRRDCDDKGRHAHGSKSPASRTNEADVIQMRLDYAAGGYSFVTLGAKYGIGHSTVEEILKRRTWKHV